MRSLSAGTKTLANVVDHAYREAGYGQVEVHVTRLDRIATLTVTDHWLGAEAIPRRYADYLHSDEFTTLHMISTVGAFVLGASVLPFIWNVFRSYRYGDPRGGRPVGIRQLT